MHVTLVNQYYWPHHAATSQLLTELGEGLVGRGHRVTAITSRSRSAEGVLAPAHERRRGVDVIRLSTTHRGKARIADRVMDYGTFYGGAMAKLAGLAPRPDVVLALTTPPLIAVASQLAGLLRRFPTVSVVQDVYPDIAVALGVLRDRGPVARAWRLAAAASLRASTAIVVLSEAMRRRLSGQGVDDRLHVIPNWALAELDGPGDSARGRARYGLTDELTVMYSGNMGAGHTFDAVLDAACRLRSRKDIRFVLVGDGLRRAEIATRIAADKLDATVSLHPYAPRAALADSLAAGDLHLVTMRDHVEGLIMPSKLYGIFAAARPVLFVGPATGSVAATVREAGAGAVFATDAGDALADTIVALADDPGARAEMGAAGHHYIRHSAGRDHAIARYDALLRSQVST